MSPVKTLGLFAQQYIELCKRLDPFWVISIMTLLSVVRYQEGAWYFVIFSSIFLGLACLFPKIIKHELFWFGLCILLGSTLISYWAFLGNHAFSLFYWLLALFISCFVQKRLEFLALSARWIIGFIFLFAFMWKLISGDFSTGATMRYLLTSTLPLGQTAVLLTSLTQEQLMQNIRNIDSVISFSTTSPARIIAPPDVSVLADVLTRATQFVEGTLALCFLVPLPRRWQWLREASLIGFFVTAYTILPVAPFSTQFAFLGYALTTSPVYRAVFIASYFIAQLADLRLGSLWADG